MTRLGGAIDTLARACHGWAAGAALAAAACSPAPGAVAGSGTGSASAVVAAHGPTSTVVAPSGVTAAPGAASAAGQAPVAPSAAVPRSHALPDDVAERVVYPSEAELTAALVECPRAAAHVACLVGRRLRDDAAAAKVARDLLTATGDVVGVEREHVMDGAFRGQIRLVPEPPIGRHRRHLEWVAAAATDFDEFFAALARKGPGAATAPDAGAAGSVSYRWRGIALKFFRSVGRTTPSAYATGWSVAYNVSGSLHGSADAVRETMFHEIFHLNDADHRDWSSSALSSLYDGIVARCTPRGADRRTTTPTTTCVAPYAPNETMLKIGGYYAFHPDNGVREYAAELAIRYYREQRAALGLVRAGGGPAARGGAPFKCGPAENGRAWDLLAREFFGGIDHVPPCASPR